VSVLVASERERERESILEDVGEKFARVAHNLYQEAAVD
jgi:hypothetical protein